MIGKTPNLAVIRKIRLWYSSTRANLLLLTTYVAKGSPAAVIMLMAAQECPHSSYPLSNGTPFDIEDFGVVLSSGISCPKHDWSFDLHTGRSDRGNYKLQVWEIQERVAQEDNGVKDIWVRRKQRIG
jgi:nitrite reductase/ring-hydroxylating ferredoxin subunit